MSKNYAIIIHFVLPLATFYRSGVQRSDVNKSNAFVTSWRFLNRAWQPQRHDRLPETSGTLWIHRGALTKQRCSLATRCGINQVTHIFVTFHISFHVHLLLVMSVYHQFHSGLLVWCRFQLFPELNEQYGSVYNINYLPVWNRLIP